MNAYDRASRHLFFNTVKDSIESIRKLFSTPSDADLDNDNLQVNLKNYTCKSQNDTCKSQNYTCNLQVGRFIKTVDFLLEEIDTLDDMEGFERVQVQAEWLITFAMSVAKSDMSKEYTDEKDIVNACNHLVNEFGHLKEALSDNDNDDQADLSLAKEVVKDFIEVTEQSVNSALLRLIGKVQFYFISWQFCTQDGVRKCEFCDFSLFYYRRHLAVFLVILELKLIFPYSSSLCRRLSNMVKFMDRNPGKL